MHRLTLELVAPPYGLVAQPTLDYGDPISCIRDFETVAGFTPAAGKRIFVSCATHCRLMNDVVQMIRQHLVPDTVVVAHLKSLRAKRILRAFVTGRTLVTESPFEEMAFLSSRGIPAMAVRSDVRESLLEAGDDVLRVGIPRGVATFQAWPDELLKGFGSRGLKVVSDQAAIAKSH